MNDARDSRGSRKVSVGLKYPPFIFAASLAGLLLKTAISLSTGNRVVDWAFGSALAIAFVSLLVYAWEHHSKKVGARSVRIRVGKAKDSEVVGISSACPDTGKDTVEIASKDLDNSVITGIEHGKDKY